MDRAVGEIHAVVKVAGSLQEALHKAAAVTSGIDVIAMQTGLFALDATTEADRISETARLDTSYTQIPGTDHGPPPAPGRSPNRLQGPGPARLQKVSA